MSEVPDSPEGLWREIQSRLEEVRDAIQEHSRTIRAAEESKRLKEQPPTKVHAVIAYDDQTLRNTKTDQDRQYRTQNSIRKAAWAAFAAATIYAGIAALSYFPMRKAADAAKDAANTAQKSLDSSDNTAAKTLGEMQRQNATMRAAMITSTRAYLALGQVKIFCPICETRATTPPTSTFDNNASISIYFINSGHSPAHDVDKGTGRYGGPVPPLDQKFTFVEQPDALDQPKHMIVQASPEFPLEVTRGTRAELILLARGQVPFTSANGIKTFRLYVYGHVSYSDVFEQRHTLLYCVEYHPTTAASPEQWSVCAYHNEEYDGNYKP